ncbi:MAG: hypothetical protein ABR551_13415 [Gemmatimonadales bacterium]
MRYIHGGNGSWHGGTPFERHETGERPPGCPAATANRALARATRQAWRQSE